MFKSIIYLLFIFIVKVFAQPVSTQFHLLEQKDSLYYLITEDALYKFYSLEASGEFFLTKYLQKSFPNDTKLSLNDDYLFLTHNDSVFTYSNTNPFELELVNVFTPEITVNSIHGFGPYFFIRSNFTYSLYKIENQSIFLVKDSLFISPSDELVFFTYPYVVKGSIVYKYIENFDFYEVTQLSIHFVTSAINENIVTSFYQIDIPGYKFSQLKKTTIKEPDFPVIIYADWGFNIEELFCPCNAYLESSKNLLFINFWADYWPDLITNFAPKILYKPFFADKAKISDYYIFLLGGDTLKYSPWYEGSTFYPVVWTDLTDVKNFETKTTSYFLSQNYPNPFNPATIINYQIPADGFVTLKVYDILGKEVATLVNEQQKAGRYNVTFNASNLSSGVYIYELRSGEFIQSKKMMLLR